MCQKPATTPAKAQVCATTLVTSTTAKLVERPRKISWWLRTSRPARSGMATEKATTQILADRSSEPAVRNGCTI
jgi:hypothetical protein